jgi:DNA-binding NarL/FixJ family response regulator
MQEGMVKTGERVRVMLCDDSRSLATLIEHWLEEHDDLEFAGAIQHTAECRVALDRMRPDVVLLDTMGNPRDPSTLNAIRAASPGTRVLIYSGYVALLGAEALPPADGFVDKGASEDELVAAIRSARDDA